jgi:hypothetical protein
MRRCGLLALCVLMISACSDAPQDPIEIARRQIEVAPDDPAPRVALARLYLAQGRGDLADVLIGYGTTSCDHPCAKPWGGLQ